MVDFELDDHSTTAFRQYKLFIRFVACGWVLFIIFAAVFVEWRSRAVVPMIGGDQVWFYPIYESVANDHILRHPFLSPISINNTELSLPNADGGSPLIWHGWLQEILFGNLSRWIGAGIDSILMVDGIFVMTGVGLYFTATRRFLPSNPAIQLLGGVATFTALLSYVGRPELLASILLLTWYNVFFRLSERAMTCATPVILGMIAVTQPTIAVISTILLFSIIIIDNKSTHPIRLWIALNSAALIVMLTLVYLLYPYHLKDWLYGLYLHGQYQVGRGDGVGFVSYWITNPLKPLHGLICLAGLIVLLTLMARASSGYVAKLAALWVVAAVWQFGVRIPANNYNVFAFVPILCAFFVTILGSPALDLVAAPWLRWGLRGTITLAGITAVLPILIALNSLRIDNGERAEVQYFLNKTLADGKSIAITPELLISAVPYRSWKSYKLISSNNFCETSASVIIIQQADTGRFEPPIEKNCTLKIDNYSRSRQSIFGLKLPLVPKGYGFAVYTNDGASDHFN
jgi:hypothetical protein